MTIYTWISSHCSPMCLAALLVAPVASPAPLAPVFPPPQDFAVQDTRAALSEWVETRRVISKEQRDWVLGREILEDRIAIVQREIDGLRARIAEAEASLGEAESKRQGLVEENEALKQTMSVLVDAVHGMETRTGDLLERVPEPISERVKPLSQQFPEDAEETTLTMSQRFQNVIGVLNAINKFNREISLTSELRTLADGSVAEVAALYVGIGRGYYVNARADAAGSGGGGQAAWAWTAQDQSAADIAAAIAIFKNERAAEFVRLPLSLEQ